MFKKEENFDLEIFRTLSQNQKISIINLLFLIARCDGEVSNQPNENKFICSFLSAFKINFNNCMKYFDLGGIKSMIADLISLSRQQKEYLLLTSYDLMLCDGKVNETEINITIHFFEQLGISEDECFEIIQKTVLLIQMGNKH